MARAIVLSGGAIVGMAWQIGVVSGLVERGVNLADADLVLGTAAGASFGWRLAGGRAPSELAAKILAEHDAPSSQTPARTLAAPIVSSRLLLEMQQQAIAGHDPVASRREIGALALNASTVSEATFMENLGRSVPSGQGETWPTNFGCTAIDAETGEVVVWRAASGIDLAKGVFSSCTVPGSGPPITINGRRYITGAIRSVSNADLAAGHEVVVVLAMRSPPEDATMSKRIELALEFEVGRLKDSGVRVELIRPDETSMTALGRELANVLDTGRRPDACRAGISQGEALAAALRPLWN